ncbi:MAG: hypothetical protein M1832_002200 [Thelocarpon impressellum]|nr:MAG: hypothetical protein M1832_002200 [Thelocarpon impressellum]
MNVVGSQPALSPDASWVLVMLFSDEPVTSDDVHRWLRSMDISTDQSPFIEGHECPHVWDIVLDRTVAERLPLESMGFTTCHGSDRSLANRWEPQRQAEMAFIRIASKAIRQMADTGYSSAFRAAAGLDFLRRSVEREILLGDLRVCSPTKRDTVDGP